jgi:selenocysteine lyase/cysteine desulfurase
MPTWSGAEADAHWDYQGKLDFLPTASRYDFATQNFALVDGLNTAIDYMSAIGFDKIEARIQHLTGLLRSGLERVAGGSFKFLTPATSVTGLTTIKLKNIQYQTFANELMASYKVRTRVVPESNLEANRFSAHIYTSEQDIERFLDAVQKTIGKCSAGK